MYRRRVTNLGPTGPNPGFALKRLLFGHGGQGARSDSGAVHSAFDAQAPQAKQRKLYRSGGWRNEQKTPISEYSDRKSDTMAKYSSKRSGSSAPKRRYLKRSTKGRPRRAVSRPRYARKFRGKSPGARYSRVRKGRGGYGAGRGGFAKRVLNVVTRQNQSLNTYKKSVIDYMKLEPVNTAAATSLVAYRNQRVYAGGPTAGTMLYCATDDPIVIRAIANNVSSAGTTRFTRLAYKVGMKLTNMGNMPCELVHYRCRVRKDLPLSTVGTTYGQFQALMKNGWLTNSAGLGTAAIAGVDVIGGASVVVPRVYSLFENPDFVRTFKVTKVKTFKLAGASSCQLRYKLTKPKVFKYNDFQNQAGEVLQELFAGQYISVFVLRGVLGYDKSLAAANQLGYTGAEIAIEQHTEVDYTWTDDRSKAFGTNMFATGLSAGHVPAPMVENFNLNVVARDGGNTQWVSGQIGQAGTSADPDPIIEDEAQ